MLRSVSSGAWVLAAIVAAAGLAGCARAKPAPPPRRANVVLVSFDTLRADMLGAYGNALTRSPTLDRLAAEGVRFDHAVTTVPYTPAALWSLLYAEQVRDFTYETVLARAHGARGSVAEQFARAGYRTVAVVGSSQLKNGLGYERGFQRYLDTWGEPALGNETTLARLLEVREELRAANANGQPFFLYVHFFDPHAPWDGAPAAFRNYPPEESRFSRLVRQHGTFRRPDEFTIAQLDESLRRYSGVKAMGELRRDGRYEALIMPMYRSEVSWSDDVLRRMLEALSHDGLMTGAFLGVTADHGISFAEHYQSTGYGFSLFDETTRIPMLVSGPGVAPRQVKDAVSIVDLGPTLLDLAGLGERFADGRSARDLIAGRPQPRAVYAEALALPPGLEWLFYDDQGRYRPGVDNAHRMLVQGTRKLIQMPARTGAKFELYDLERDPAELTDLYEGSDPGQQALVQQLLARRSGTAAAGGPEDPEQRERLRALGYVQ